MSCPGCSEDDCRDCLGTCWSCEGFGTETQNMDLIQCHVCNGKGTAEAAWEYDRGF